MFYAAFMPRRNMHVTTFPHRTCEPDKGFSEQFKYIYF